MPRPSTATLCSRVDCALPRRHRGDCADTDNLHEGPDACAGCLPAQAADGLHLCTLHLDRIREDALTCAQLHTDLALQLRPHGRSEHTSGSRDRSNVPDAAVMDARHHIACLLTGMVELMVGERGFSPPALSGHWRSIQTPDPLSTSRRAASDVEVLAAYVAHHSEWFAAHPDAGVHAKALHDATHGRVWALAYPSRGRDYQEIGTCPLTVTFYAPDGTLAEGTCGGRVYWYPEQSALAYCDLCDQAETIEWWRREMLGDPDAVIDTVAAAAWLSEKWRRPVMPSQIANWASRGKLPRLLDDDGCLKRDPRGRQLYRLDQLEECAAKMFGAPPVLRPHGRAAAAS